MAPLIFGDRCALEALLRRAATDGVAAAMATVPDSATSRYLTAVAVALPDRRDAVDFAVGFDAFVSYNLATHTPTKDEVVTMLSIMTGINRDSAEAAADGILTQPERVTSSTLIQMLPGIVGAVSSRFANRAAMLSSAASVLSWLRDSLSNASKQSHPGSMLLRFGQVIARQRVHARLDGADATLPHPTGNEKPLIERIIDIIDKGLTSSPIMGIIPLIESRVSLGAGRSPYRALLSPPSVYSETGDALDEVGDIGDPVAAIEDAAKAAVDIDKAVKYSRFAQFSNFAPPAERGGIFDSIGGFLKSAAGTLANVIVPGSGPIVSGALDAVGGAIGNALGGGGHSAPAPVVSAQGPAREAAMTSIGQRMVSPGGRANRVDAIKELLDTLR